MLFPVLSGIMRWSNVGVDIDAIYVQDFSQWLLSVAGFH